MGKQTRESQQPRQQPAKKPEAAPAPQPKAAPQPKRDQNERRLPDGATFTVSYSEAAKRWTGKLAIFAAVFDSSATGVFRLLMNLDAAYRRSINAPAATAPDPVLAHQAAAGNRCV